MQKISEGEQVIARVSHLQETVKEYLLDVNPIFWVIFAEEGYLSNRHLGLVDWAMVQNHWTRLPDSAAPEKSGCVRGSDGASVVLFEYRFRLRHKIGAACRLYPIELSVRFRQKFRRVRSGPESKLNRWSKISIAFFHF